VRILFNDIIQTANVPASLKSPALDEITSMNTFIIDFDPPRYIDSVGIGNADTETITLEIEDTDGNIKSVTQQYEGSGLYSFPQGLDAVKLSVFLTGGYIGRLAAGRGVHMGTGKAKEPSYNSTAAPRKTLAGQKRLRLFCRSPRRPTGGKAAISHASRGAACERRKRTKTRSRMLRAVV
jgi:hypothetical protein